MQVQFHVDIVPLACIFVKNETTAQVFSWKFCKIFNNTYFVEHLQRVPSNYMIIARVFCKIYFSLKWKIKEYQRQLLLKNFYVSF